MNLSWNEQQYGRNYEVTSTRLEFEKDEEENFSRNSLLVDVALPKIRLIYNGSNYMTFEIRACDSS